MALDLNDHLLQAPDGLLATLLGDLLRQIALGLVGELLGAAHLRRGDRCVVGTLAILGNGSGGSASLVLDWGSAGA